MTGEGEGEGEGERLETGWLPDTPADDTLTRRFVLGFAEWIESMALASRHLVLRTDDLVAVDQHSRHALMNCGVLLRPVTPARVGAVVEAVSGFFGGEGGPHALFCPWPTELPGFALGGHPPLMLRMAPADAPVPVAALDALDVVECTTPELLADYERVLVDGFPLESLQPWQPGGALHPALLHVPGMRMFVGRAEGRAVTAATSIVAHGVNHVEWVATMPDARGRGFGEAITWAATLAAPSMPAVLVASDMGRPVYERMGYVALDRWTFLVRER